MKNRIISLLNNLEISFEFIKNLDIPIENISIIKYANEYDLCYLDNYVPELISDKTNITLVCNYEFNEINKDINYIKTENPKLVFYYLSSLFGSNNEFVLDKKLSKKYNSYIGINCEISEDVIIHPNVTIRSNTKIGKGVTIESGSVIGSSGLLWVWDKDRNKKIMLSLTGGTIIKDDCYICSNVSIVRGSCNENTVIEKGVMIAPGTAIGHGSFIDRNVHIANNVTIGGSVYIGKSCFLGSGSSVQPGLSFCSNSILGTSSLLTKNIYDVGVYAGIPAKKVKEITDKIKGVPR